MRNMDSISNCKLADLGDFWNMIQNVIRKKVKLVYKPYVKFFSDT